MKKILDQSHCLIKAKHFPYKSYNTAYKRHTVLLGVGGNVGDNIKRFQKLLIFLQKDKRINVHASSLILKNPPFGYTEQADFYNTVIKISTNLKPLALLRYVKWLEKRFARVKNFENGPRTLDLDIIFFDKLSYNNKILQIPHPKWQERASVLVPLYFLEA